MLLSNSKPADRSLIAKTSRFLGSCTRALTSAKDTLRPKTVDPIPITTIRQSTSVDDCAVPLPSLFQTMEMIPVEILEEILVYTLLPINRPQARQRTTLALVCYRWNAVAQKTSILWSTISSSDKLSQVEKALAKSDGLPIDVYGFWSKKADFAEIRNFVELVNCHKERWRHVTMEFVSRIPLGPTGGPAPLLESLEVCGGPLSPIQVSDGLATLPPVASMPRLREVCINGLEMTQLNMQSFPSTLSKLIIKGARYYSLGSFSKLLTILTSCPGLTALELSSRHDDSVPYKEWAALPIVELPALRELTLWKLGRQAIRVILQRLQFPHECVVRLSADLCPDPCARLTSTLAHHLDDLRNGGIDQITFTLERSRFVMRTQGPRWNMELEVGSFVGVRDIVLLLNPEDMATCAEGLPHDRIPVTLEFKRDVLVSWALGRLSELSDLGSIASLKVDTYQGAHLAILSHLATPAIKEGAMPTWPLPGLMELHFKGPIAKIDPVIEFVEKRRGKGNRLGTPAPPQRIEFVGKQMEWRGLSPSEPSGQAWPDSLLDLLNLLDWGAQVIWDGERLYKE